MPYWKKTDKCQQTVAREQVVLKVSLTRNIHSLCKMQQKRPLPSSPSSSIPPSLHPSISPSLIPDRSASQLSKAIRFRSWPRERLQGRRSGTALRQKAWQLLLLCSATFPTFSVGPAFCCSPQRRKESQTSEGKEKGKVRDKGKLCQKTEVSVRGGIQSLLLTQQFQFFVIGNKKKSWEIQFLKAQTSKDEAKMLWQTM